MAGPAAPADGASADPWLVSAPGAGRPCAGQVQELRGQLEQAQQQAERAAGEAGQQAERAGQLQRAVEDLSAQEAKSQDELRAQASAAEGRARRAPRLACPCMLHACGPVMTCSFAGGLGCGGA